MNRYGKKESTINIEQYIIIQLLVTIKTRQQSRQLTRSANCKNSSILNGCCKKVLPVLLLFSASFSSTYCQDKDTVFYSVVTTGIVNGALKIWKNKPHETGIRYYFTDRGLGPDYKSLINTTEEGLITSLEIEGVDYNKNHYKESFSTVGDSVQWITNGIVEKEAFKSKFYLSFLTPGSYDLLVNWLLKQPDREGRITGGFCHLKDMGVKNMKYKGKMANLKAYGLCYGTTDDAKGYVWWDNDNNNFFGVAQGWRSTVRKGYESWTDTLFSMQEHFDEPYYKKQIAAFSSELPRHFSITHATVFHSETAVDQKDMTVEVVNGKIVAMYPSGKNLKPKGDTIIDAKGKFLMPGLWDMHCHYEKSRGLPYLAGGVTHVRDMGNSPIIIYYKNEIGANRLLGPDVSYCAGFIDRKGPFQGPTGKLVGSLKEALEAIREYHRTGYQAIKIYSSIDPAWMAPMSAQAHRLGMNVLGHIPTGATGELAVDAGFNELSHIHLLFKSLLGGDTMSTRGRELFTMVGDHAPGLDFGSTKVKAFLKLLKEKHVRVDPTVSNVSDIYDEFKGDTSGPMKAVVRWLPEGQRSSLSIEQPFSPEEKKKNFKITFQRFIQMTRLLYDGGITLVAGTDGGDALALARELELYVEAGIPSPQVLKIATYNAAKACRLENVYGQIKSGKMADFILIDGNPMQNIGDLRRVEWVMKNSKSYSPKQLLKSWGWNYYY